MYLGKEVRVLLKDEAKDSFLELKKRTDKESLSIVASIERVIDILKDNPQFGDPIAKKQIPSSLKTNDIQNLYRIALSNYWRMLYTIKGDQVEIFLFVLSIVDHKGYDKLFGYK
ncbi:hypothetical protein COY28_03300 [Candidatus Woesearchaeota archaeon CG_4_10_14_0_2_um_filter_57_5]|nr:MAG: hypothetical protein COY28_03300 [Candidatus Woesearchaeota archaeon CG_4_10_14_0_2_um_filter_57_5]